MSYNRSYSEKIAMHYSGSVSYSYPASQTGGTGSAHYNGTVYEDVNVNIHVDTNQFDNSVSNCNSSVNLLTGAVVATESAQVVAINKNAKKVAGSIIKGFFDYIRSDISQQIMELSQKIEANMLHLRELAKSCLSKQKQMEADYNRISSRYLKVFEDLNHELENRVFELDKPAFVFKKSIDNHANRTSDNDLVSTVTVFGKEGGELQAKISASIVKKRAANAISQINMFLWKQKKLQSTINISMLNENFSGAHFAPLCFIETNSEQNKTDRHIYQPTFLPNFEQNKMVENFKSKNWGNTTKEQKENIQRYFNTEISNAYNSNSRHDERVKNMIVTIFNVNTIKTVNN
jgi:hypothetical protein